MNSTHEVGSVILLGMAALDTIVILVTGDPVDSVAATRGDYAKIIGEAIGDAWTGPYRALDARTDDLPSLSDGDALIISGSSANVHAREPWMVRTEGWLAREVQRETPVLGLCFGHQLIAQALGGHISVNPRGREIGTVMVETIEDDPLLTAVPSPFAANACHSDTVSRLPDGARVLARSPGDPHQAIRFSERCYGVQFHPELDGDVTRQFIKARSDAMHAEGLDPAEAHARTTDTPHARSLLAAFVKQMRG